MLVMVDEVVDEQVVFLLLLLLLLQVPLVRAAALFAITQIWVKALGFGDLRKRARHRLSLVGVDFLINDVLDLVEIFTLEVLVVAVLDLADSSADQRFHLRDL